MRLLILPAIIVSLTFTVLGCDDGSGSVSTPRTNSPSDYFNENQQGTSTPDGEVIPGSFVDVGDAKVQYDTEGGNTFQADVAPTGDGGYRLTDVEKVSD